MGEKIGRNRNLDKNLPDLELILLSTKHAMLPLSSQLYWNVRAEDIDPE